MSNKEGEGAIRLITLAESYSDVSSVKVETLPAPDNGRDAWLKLRKKGIGGSDVGAIMGVDPYRTARDVYYDKVSEGTEQQDSPHMKRGRALESLIMKEYMQRHPEDTLLPAQFAQHPQHPWMIGTPDAYIASPHHTGEKGVLEVKCPAKHAFEKIKWYGIPNHYYLQMQHYLAITGLSWGLFVVFNADAWEMITIEVEAWTGSEMQTLIDLEAHFWNTHVVPQAPPTETKERVELPKVTGSVHFRDDQAFVSLTAAYVAAQRDAKAAAELQESIRDALKDAIHQEMGVYEGGGYRVYNTAVAGRKTLDKKALNAFLQSHGSTVSNYETQGNDFTTLRVYETGEE